MRLITKIIKYNLVLSIMLLIAVSVWADSEAYEMSLNGVVDFEQTTTAFPPKKFSRKIQVPGLIDLAKPKIDQYEEYFLGTHEPRYSWYRFEFEVPKGYEDQYATLKILKSRYSTQITINGIDVGTYIQNSTPIECNLTKYLDHNKKNVLLVRVGERAWLSNEAATGFDREKFTDIPGIWDKVSIRFSGPVVIHKSIILPLLEDRSITAKIRVENLADFVNRDMEMSIINYKLNLLVREKLSKKVVSEEVSHLGEIKCQQEQFIELNIPMKEVINWSPETPFLYEAVISIEALGKKFSNYGNSEIPEDKQEYDWIGASDIHPVTFGMRSFNKVGKSFELNGDEYRLFGTTLTLNRFFEDRSRAHLPWDEEWVRKLMVDIPKAIGWNYFRVHIGLLPDFWYDLADEYGFVIQNEFPMWNLRGRDSGYKKEYTDWIWSDGNHPSIVIWDALNEQKEAFIGNTLIPELRKLDPTRVWDAGFMDAKDLNDIEMVEYHWYPFGFGWWSKEYSTITARNGFEFGLLSASHKGLNQLYKINTPVIVNEFGWLWQNRDGLNSSIRTSGFFDENDNTPRIKNYEYYEADGSQLYPSRDIYEYFVGKNASAKERWDFQTYLLAIEIETVRSTRQAAGVASFTYLVNDKGYVGDWFKTPVRELNPTSALIMQHHTMRPFAAFIDLKDGRYHKSPEVYTSGERINFNVLVINDLKTPKTGNITIRLIDRNQNVIREMSQKVEVDAFWQQYQAVSIELPEQEGAYLIQTELSELNGIEKPQLSFRYIRIGENQPINYPDFKFTEPINWPKEL